MVLAGRGSTTIPLAFILFIGICKGLFEDYHRALDDSRINQQVVEVFTEASAPAVTLQWQDLAVGNVVRLFDNDPVPADMIVLASSNEDRPAFVDDCKLNGGSNLRKKFALTNSFSGDRLGSIILPTGVSLRGLVDCDQMLPDLMHSFSGIMYTDDHKIRGVSLDHTNLLLRGSTLRNTEWVYGLVIYAGMDTKLGRSACRTIPSKKSHLEHSMDRFVGWVFLLLVILSLLSAILLSAMGPDVQSSLQVLSGSKFDFSEYDGVAYENGVILNFLKFLVLFNQLIPVSLYLVFDLLRFLHSVLKDHDYFCIIRSASGVDNLGQVDFVLADKTGTLTKNQMRFKYCAIGDRLYGGNTGMDALDTSITEPIGDPVSAIKREISITTGVHPGNDPSFGPGFSVRSSVDSVWTLGDTMPNTDALLGSGSSFNGDMSRRRSILKAAETYLNDGINDDSDSDSERPERKQGQKKCDSVADRVKRLQEQTERIHEFFMCLVTNHSVIPSIAENEEFFDGRKTAHSLNQRETVVQAPLDTIQESEMDHAPKGNRIKHLRYQSSSQDEMALVDAAHDFGYKFVRRVDNRLFVLIDNVLRCFQLLVTIPFTSERKRMSVAVQELEVTEMEAKECFADLEDPYFRGSWSSLSSFDTTEGQSEGRKGAKGPTVLYVKGSAASMKACLGQSDNNELQESMKVYLNAFGERGLRTMVIAHRVLTVEESNTLVQEFKRATNALVERPSMILGKLATNWERRLQYLGITAVEDCVHEGVPRTIRTLWKAGVKLWVLTGDGAETTTSIALSCRIIDPSTKRLVLSGGQDMFARLCDMYKKMTRYDNIDEDYNGEFVLVIDSAALNGITDETQSVVITTPRSSVERNFNTMDLKEDIGTRMANENLLTATQKALQRCQELFVAIAIRAKAVIACDMSPSQKAVLVRLLHEYVEGRPVTLAIGWNHKMHQNVCSKRLNLTTFYFCIKILTR